MSDEPQPLRLRPRPPAGGAPSSPPDAQEPPAPPPPPADGSDANARLRLKPRLTLAPEPQAAPEPAPAAYEAPPEPPPPPPAPADDVPRIKLRPKAPAAPPRPPPPPAYEPPPPPESFDAPPPAPAEALDEPPPPPPPPPTRTSLAMPPMSVLSPPPPPGGDVAAPPPPGGPLGKPGLTLGKGSLPKGLNMKVTSEPPRKVGGKVVAKPQKAATVLRKRPALSLVAKAGIAFVVVALVVGGIFSYRIFFPEAGRVVKIPAPVVTKPTRPGDIEKTAAEMVAKVSSATSKAIDSGESAILAKRAQEQAKVDAAASGQDAPTAAPSQGSVAASDASQSVMADSSLTSDVKVNSQKIDAVPTASAAFRGFVADASIGGVFQGTPSRALINGTIVREGQVVSNALGIVFVKIDADQKVIYFKDATGAQVSKNY